MEIDLENLYVDVRAKKIKDHCHLATHSKLAFLWKKHCLVGKSTVGH